MILRFAPAFIAALVLIAAMAAAAPDDKLAPPLSATADAPAADVLVFLADQADLRPAAAMADRRTRARRVCAALQATAAAAQPAVCTLLDAGGYTYRRFWIANVIAVVRADPALLAALADRDDVAHVVPDPLVALEVPRQAATAALPTIPWNIEHIGAPQVWATGNTGQDAVVGILDTGCDWQHAAVRDQYRGWDGDAVDHDYNWHDAVHTGGGICGADAPEPCDDLGHGTHVLGTAVGDDGQGTEIGVAPGARWIACRCIDGGWATPSMFYEGFEWMLAPRPVGSGPGDPDLAPDVVTTAWYCPPHLGCAWDTLLPAVAALRAAGILVVGTGGGDGPGCGTIVFPPAIYDETYTVGATGPADVAATFGGRGPVITDQGDLVKPDITAPGVDVLSCLPGDDYAVWSGGAMATAHLAGVVALVVTAEPTLAGHPDAIEDRLNASALQLLSDQCGDGGNVPNNVYGHGRVDAYAACAGPTAALPLPASALVQLLPGAPNPFNPRTVLTYALPGPGPVSLRIHDVTGCLVRILVDGEWQEGGRHDVAWDGRDDHGREAPAGVYLCHLQSGGAVAQGRLALVR